MGTTKRLVGYWDESARSVSIYSKFRDPEDGSDFVDFETWGQALRFLKKYRGQFHVTYHYEVPEGLPF